MNYITQFDTYILDVIQQIFQNSFFDTIFPILTSFGNMGFIWIMVGLVLLCNKKSRRYGVLLFLALGISFVVGNLTLKHLVMRVRPCEVNTTFPLLIARPLDSSFPSGHTFSSFACAGVIWGYNRKLGIIALAVAVLMGFSRLYLYVHYPTDVLTGMVLGIVTAYLSIYIGKKFMPSRKI